MAVTDEKLIRAPTRKGSEKFEEWRREMKKKNNQAVTCSDPKKLDF